MTNIVRLNQLPEGSGNLTSDDIFIFMDSPSSSSEAVTKKISLSELKSIINAETDVNISTCLLHEYADPSGVSTPTSVTIDGMSYGGGQVVSDSAFGPNSSRVTLYADSMFAMVAVNANIDTVYYNGESGSDGDGDKSLSVGVSDYRGYYSYHNLISGDDPAIQQIVISKSSTMSGSNRSTDTNNDDFTVTGLSGSDIVVVLNLYWDNSSGPDYSNSTTVAIQQFIDLVMFDDTTPRTNINDIRTAFYDNSATIKTAIENENSDLLVNGFEFYRSFQKVTPSGGSGSGAVLEIEVFDNGDYDDEDVLVPGTGYQVGNTLTVSGDLLGGTTPTNDVTITVNSINGTGGIIGYSTVGTSISTLWPDSYIIDGDDDQYDIGNFIGTNRTRSTAMVTLEYDPIEEDGNGGDDVFQILTILSADKTISEGQWVWFEEQNKGAFINYTLSTIGTINDRLVNGEYEIVLGSDGSLTFPDGSIQNSATFKIAGVDLHNGGVQSSQILQFDDDSKQSIITGPTPASGTNSQRIIIQGQRAQGNGDGGDVYVWGGDADTNGGDIKIYAGDADNVSPDGGYGGYVNIDGGKGAITGGDVEITAGYSVGGQAGDVLIVGGSTSSGVAGVVNINSNNKEWVFGADGGLTLPGGGIITDDVETVTLSGAGTVGVNQTYGLLSAIGVYLGRTDSNYQIDPREAPSTGYQVRLNTSPLGYYESTDLITWTVINDGSSPVPTGVVTVANITLAVDTSNWTFGTSGSLTFPSGSILSETFDPILEVNGLSIMPPAAVDGQSLVIRATASASPEYSHIHLVAGSPASVDLYLGDDAQYVKIEKNGGNVVIGTDGDNQHWTFDKSGSILFPNDTIQTSAGVTSDVALVSIINSFAITNMVSMSQANYDALVTKDSSTLYIIS